VQFAIETLEVVDEISCPTVVTTDDDELHLQKSS
jgi:hypothetical protein